VSTAAAQSTPAGSVRVVTAHRTVTVSAKVLAHLPSRTVSVTFTAGTGAETHTESGPPLSLFNDLTREAVLAAAVQSASPLIVQTSVKTVKAIGSEVLFAMWTSMTAGIECR
jgi:hypothetical protein